MVESKLWISLPKHSPTQSSYSNEEGLSKNSTNCKEPVYISKWITPWRNIRGRSNWDRFYKKEHCKSRWVKCFFYSNKWGRHWENWYSTGLNGNETEQFEHYFHGKWNWIVARKDNYKLKGGEQVLFRF